MWGSLRVCHGGTTALIAADECAGTPDACRGRQIPTVECGFAPKMEQVSAPGALPARLSGSLELMSRLTIDERGAAIDALISAADEFAERAQLQETCRDRSRPGTGSHHQHAHSATLWRQAEQRLRTRILELEL
jgi:hypothetical protein